MMRSKRAAFSLVELLVVLVVIGLLAAFIAPNYLKGSKPGGNTKAAAPMQRARSVECITNLRQVRAAVTMAATTGETRPRSLVDLRPFGVTETLARCPESRQFYRMDPASGQIRCTHTGHERN